MRSWIHLLLTIGTEAIGTISVRLAATYAPVANMLLIYKMIGLFYFFPALTIRRVSVGVTYTLQEGIDIVLITAASAAWLGESIGLYGAVGLGVMITGILLIKSGIRNASGASAQPHGEVIVY